MKITHCQLNHMVRPLGYALPQLTFSWQVEEACGKRQTAARLILWKSEGELLYDSGFAALDNADIALGPTMDGGYYLIGMKQPRKSVFQIEGYGGDTVYQRTVEAAQAASLTVETALPCNDVDTPEDLQQLAWVADPDSYTGRCLIQLAKEGISL